jgi:hypothetical protein
VDVTAEFDADVAVSVITELGVVTFVEVLSDEVLTIPDMVEVIVLVSVEFIAVVTRDV